MKRTNWNPAPWGLAVGIVLGLLLGGGSAASAQEECVLEGSGPVNTAVEALERAREQEGTQEARQAYREAAQALEGSIADETSDPTVYFVASNAYIGLENYEEADRMLDRFLELAPECHQEAHDTRYNAWATAYNEGIRAYQEGNADHALERFEKANQIHADARAYNNAALLYHQRGETEQAMDRWREAARSGGDTEQVRAAVENLAETLLGEGRTEEAVQVYEEHLERHPDDAVSRIHYAMTLQDSGREEEASAIFEEIMGRDDLTAEQWNQVGIGLFDSESYAEAKEAFRKGREANPYAKDLMENSVSAAIQAGEAAAVAALSDTLVSWFPYDATVHQLRAHVLSRQGQGQEAMRALQRGEDSPVVFQAIQMAQVGENQYKVQGTLASREAGAGQQLTIPFEFLDSQGQVVATEEVTIQAPPAGQSTSVEVQVTSEQPIAGFRYEAGSG